MGAMIGVLNCAGENRDGLSHTLPYSAYAKHGWSAGWQRWLYRLGEHTGFSTS